MFLDVLQKKKKIQCLYHVDYYLLNSRKQLIFMSQSLHISVLATESDPSVEASE